MNILGDPARVEWCQWVALSVQVVLENECFQSLLSCLDRSRAYGGSYLRSLAGADSRRTHATFLVPTECSGSRRTKLCVYCRYIKSVVEKTSENEYTLQFDGCWCIGVKCYVLVALFAANE